MASRDAPSRLPSRGVFRKAFDQRVQVWLRRAARHRRDRRVGNVEPRLGGVEDRGGLHAAGVVRVKMDRQARFVAQRLHELGRRVRLAQSGHVFDGQDVSAELLELPGELHVVVEAILRSPRVEDVARVADRRLANRARLAHGFHRHAHVGRPVERIEDAKHVDSGGRRLAHALANDVIGIVGVPHGARGAQEHLEQDVGDPLAELLEPLPGRLLEEPHRRVERGAAPHFQ